MFIFNLGGMLSQLIILGDAGILLLSLLGNKYNTSMYRRLLILFFSVFIILPLCLYRDLSKLERASLIKLILIMFTIGVVIFQYIISSDNAPIQIHNNTNIYTDNKTRIWSYMDIQYLPEAFGIIAFCFVFHDSTFLLLNTLHNPTLSRWTIISSSGMLITFFILLLFGIPGYLTFCHYFDGSNNNENIIQSNILDNYNIHHPFIIITRFLYLIIMSIAFPSALFICRHISYSMYQKIIKHQQKRILLPNNNINMPIHNGDFTVQSAPLKHHLTFTLAIFISVLSLALCVDNLGQVFSIVGSVSCITLAFILPCLCFVKYAISKYNNNKYQNEFDIHTKPNKLSLIFNCIAEILPPIFVVILGACVGILGIWKTICGCNLWPINV